MAIERSFYPWLKANDPCSQFKTMALFKYMEIRLNNYFVGLEKPFCMDLKVPTLLPMVEKLLRRVRFRRCFINDVVFVEGNKTVSADITDWPLNKISQL